MNYWREKGRPALFEALAEVCDQIDSNLFTELNESSKNEENMLLSEQLDNVNVLVGRLRDENTLLRTQLADVKATAEPKEQDSTAQEAPDKSMKPSAAQTAANSFGPAGELANDPSLLEENYTSLRTEYANLSARFNVLSENFKKARAALERRREERDKWSRRTSYLEAKIMAAEAEHKIRILDRGDATTEQKTPSRTPKPTVTASAHASFNDITELPEHLPELPDLEAGTAQATAKTEVPASAQKEASPVAEAEVPLPESTQGEEEVDLPPLSTSNSSSQLRIKQEPSSDSPVVVSERAVRKRRRDDESTDSTAPRRIKREETDGSSPIMQRDGFHFSPQESIDLGEVSGIMATPRKRKDLENPIVPNTAPLKPLSFSTPTPLVVRPDGFPQTTRPYQFSSALTPISVNRRIARSGGDRPAVKPMEKDLGRQIGVLAEDGAVYEAEVSHLHSTGLRLKPNVKSKLESLLNNTSNEDEAPSQFPTPRQRREPATLHRDLSVPARRELPFDKVTRQSGAREQASASPSAVNSPRRAAKVGEKPDKARKRTVKGPSLLRNKPVSDLRLEDFKINPAVNDGQDFAFSEVVRNKADRSCLPGCTDMRCCGKEFRALAISQRPDPPLTPAQKEEEQRLLEEYLGDHAHRLESMSERERAELWVEAKMQELANKYGKHRHRYSRMHSPPGFWNADFPSTQELEANRSEASKREEAAIKERYREAMRPGGRWLFRDE